MKQRQVPRGRVPLPHKVGAPPFRLSPKDRAVHRVSASSSTGGDYQSRQAGTSTRSTGVSSGKSTWLTSSDGGTEADRTMARKLSVGEAQSLPGMDKLVLIGPGQQPSLDRIISPKRRLRVPALRRSDGSQRYSVVRTGNRDWTGRVVF